MPRGSSLTDQSGQCEHSDLRPAGDDVGRQLYARRKYGDGHNPWRRTGCCGRQSLCHWTTPRDHDEWYRVYSAWEPGADSHYLCLYVRWHRGYVERVLPQTQCAHSRRQARFVTLPAPAHGLVTSDVIAAASVGTTDTARSLPYHRRRVYFTSGGTHSGTFTWCARPYQLASSVTGTANAYAVIPGRVCFDAN